MTENEVAAASTEAQARLDGSLMYLVDVAGLEGEGQTIISSVVCMGGVELLRGKTEVVTIDAPYPLDPYPSVGPTTYTCDQQQTPVGKCKGCAVNLVPLPPEFPVAG
ncbi:MAG: hypothetical protein AAB557_05235 [Patescibacteria group bacterium]